MSPQKPWILSKYFVLFELGYSLALGHINTLAFWNTAKESRVLLSYSFEMF